MTSITQEQVYNILKKHPEGLTSIELYNLLDINKTSIIRCLSRLRKHGEVTADLSAREPTYFAVIEKRGTSK